MNSLRSLVMFGLLVAAVFVAGAWFYWGASPMGFFNKQQEEAVPSDDTTDSAFENEEDAAFEFQTVEGRWGETPEVIEETDSSSETGLETAAPADADLFAFAQCLTDSGWTMYGAYWCPHCTTQKELFGAAFESVDYVECAEGQTNSQPEVCADAGIQAYPTWIDPYGEHRTGTHSLETLAELSGCTAPSGERLNP